MIIEINKDINDLNQNICFLMILILETNKEIKKFLKSFFFSLYLNKINHLNFYVTNFENQKQIYSNIFREQKHQQQQKQEKNQNTKKQILKV